MKFHFFKELNEGQLEKLFGVVQYMKTHIWSAFHSVLSGLVHESTHFTLFEVVLQNFTLLQNEVFRPTLLHIELYIPRYFDTQLFAQKRRVTL